jgi:hypothetical protein
MSLFTMLLKEILELVICVLNAIICPEALNLLPSLVLHFNFPQFELGKRHRFVPHDVHPNLFGEIINKDDEIHMPSM